MLDFIQFSTGATTGGAGASTATGYSPPISGWIEKVYVEYVGSPPAGTDFTLSDEGDPGSESIVSLADNNSDAAVCPRRVLETNDGTDLTYDGTHVVYGRFVVHGRLEATVAQANDADSVTVTVWFER